MSTNFPTSLDTLTNPTASSDTALVDHAAQHADANDAIEALQAKVGIDGSAVATSVDYRLAALEAARVVGQFGSGADGNLTISSGTTTLTAPHEANYGTITISGTGQLVPARRILRCLVLDLSNAPADAVTASRAASSGASATTVAAEASSSLPMGFTNGAGGVALTASPGAAGIVPAQNPVAWMYPHTLTGSTHGGVGGTGGSGVSGSGGAGANPANASGTYYPIQRPIFDTLPQSWAHLTQGSCAGVGGGLARLCTGPSGGGGGSGAGTNSPSNLKGGDGGAGGIAADALVIFCEELIVGASTAAGAISAIGGAGAPGGNSANNNCGGGAGGGGGCGGLIMIVAGKITGTKSGAVVATGGAGGAGGTGMGTGTNGAGATGGGGGKIILYRYDTGTLTCVLGATGSAGSGTTGGAGGAATATL